MKILHIDDHILFSEGLASSLQRSELACEVLHADSFQAALDIAEANPDLDLIILDLMMPEMDGIAMMQAFIERNIMSPMVIISALEDLWQIKRALQLGALGFFPKYWNTQQLVDAIRQIELGNIVVPKDLLTQLESLPEQAPVNKKESQLQMLGISKRQMEVLSLMQNGYSNKMIAEILCISEATVKSHVKVLFQSLHASNRLECVKLAEAAGLLSLEQNTLTGRTVQLS